MVYTFVLKNKSSNWLDDEAVMRARDESRHPVTV
jgi:hypothetical protein